MLYTLVYIWIGFGILCHMIINELCTVNFLFSIDYFEYGVVWWKEALPLIGIKMSDKIRKLLTPVQKRIYDCVSEVPTA